MKIIPAQVICGNGRYRHLTDGSAGACKDIQTKDQKQSRNIQVDTEWRYKADRKQHCGSNI